MVLQVLIHVRSVVSDCLTPCLQLAYIIVHLESVTRDFSLAPLQDASKVPSWLMVNKTLIPDFVMRDPKVRQLASSCPQNIPMSGLETILRILLCFAWI